MPGYRSAAIGAAVAFAAGALALGPASLASATPTAGSSDAVILKTGLDVSLLNKTAELPLNVSLNEVHAPANAGKTLLTATLDGVDKGRPFNILHADVATTKATSDETKSEGYANLTKASVHLPGLPGKALVEVDAVTSKATCVTGQAPTAETNFVGDVTVLGKKVSVRAGGSTKVNVAGVGDVSLDLAKTVEESTTAASTALQLTVHVNPGNLNVAEVTGELTLVRASCQTQGDDGGSGGTGGDTDGGSTAGSSGGDSGGSSGGDSGGSSGGDSGSTGGDTSGGGASGGSSDDGGTKTQTGTDPGDLAETGGSSTTPYIAGAAAALVVAGGGAVYLSRRKKANA